MTIQVEKKPNSHGHTEKEHVHELLNVIQLAVPQALQKFKQEQASVSDKSPKASPKKAAALLEKVLTEELARGMIKVHQVHHLLPHHAFPALPEYLSEVVQEAWKQQALAAGQKKLPLESMKATPANLKLAAQGPMDVDPKAFYEQFKADHGDMLEAMGQVE